MRSAHNTLSAAQDGCAAFLSFSHNRLSFRAISLVWNTDFHTVFLPPIAIGGFLCYYFSMIKQ